MSRLAKWHEEVNEEGVGKCSVPMWMNGMPAGFCDKDAYGKYIPGATFFNIHINEELRYDGKYNGYVPALACPGHGGPTTRVMKDGNAWCAVHPDFINLQESPAAFGDTPEEARANLAKVPA